MYYDRLVDVPLPKYKQAKIRLLQDFDVFLSTEQKKHLETLQSEIAIDNFCRKLIDAKLNQSIKTSKKIYN